jgi:aspartyl-tRNA(Asn)/glutamyl-tRNA(Gln) amidotransferase subunit A
VVGIASDMDLTEPVSIMKELTYLSIDQAARLLARKEISPVELTRACLERIDHIDPLINSFITSVPWIAMEQARRAEAEFLKGERRGPLHGIPIALKDLYETAGIQTTAGSRHFAEYVPEKDAVVVEKLQEAGAVLLGKLNLHEIALGVTNENPHYGTCRNPWDLNRMTGGSSGGSAAALAAGLCLGSLGSDTGGSIRIPASLCGVVGLKPTFGRVSLRGVMPLSWNLDHVGPMARQVIDVAHLLQIISGYDEDDPTCIDIPVGDYLTSLTAGIHGWRVALLTGEYIGEADDHILATVRQAAGIMESLGARLEEVELSYLLQAAQANSVIVTSDAAAVHQERINNHPEDFGTDVLKRLLTGAAYSSTEYILARRTQTLIKRHLEAVFKQYDLLILPSTPILAPPLQALDAVERARQLTRFTAPFNLTGLPAISLPCGFVREGEIELPVGLQMVAPAWGEVRLLRAAYAYEQATQWHLRRPDLQQPFMDR